MSVEKRERGGRVRWLARWRDPTGAPRSRTFDRKADAVAYEAERRRGQQLGAHAPAEPSGMTLEAWLVEWFASGMRRWRPNTINDYDAVLGKWVRPYLAHYRLKDLGRRELRRWRDGILAEGCPPHQANKATRVLRSALAAAVDEDLLPSNPATILKALPASEAPTTRRGLTPDEAELIRAYMPTLRDVVLWGLLCYAGLRPGEARALTWGCVDGDTLVIERSVSADVIGPTKTRSIRTVDVIPPLAADLDLLRPKVADPDALVIPGPGGEVLEWSGWRRYVFRPAIKAAGVKAVPYDGRHTAASLLIHEGRSIPYVCAFLGHSSANVTLSHYAHAFDAARHATRAPMAKSVAAARRKLERRGVYPACTRNPVRTLRTAKASA